MARQRSTWLGSVLMGFTAGLVDLVLGVLIGLAGGRLLALRSATDHLAQMFDRQPAALARRVADQHGERP